MARGPGVQRYKIICKECDEAFPSSRCDAKFCGQACRTSFTNRRRDRGAVLYDLFMACRYDRDAAKADGLWGLMCRAAEDFNQQDKRDQRQSWVKFKELAADGRFTKYSYVGKGRV